MRQAQLFYAKNEDVTLHYRVFGEGFPVLLLSGGPGGSSNELLPVATELEKTNRVILLDQRATGESAVEVVDGSTINLAAYVADVEAVRRDLGVDRWVILGHSWGGALAMAVAAEHPEHVAGLILVESAGINLGFLQHAPGNLRHTAEDQAAMEHWSDPARVAEDPGRAAYESYQAWVSGAVYDRGKVSKVMAQYTPELRTSVIANLMMQNLMAIGYDLREALASFSSPVLIVHGRQGFMGEATALQIHETLARSTMVLLEECGHYPMFEQPGRMYEHVQAFLVKYAC